jgi:CubicO group peptidase (beta-lactamase class C family)
MKIPAAFRLTLALILPGAEAGAQQPTSTDPGPRITRVERGLLPTVAIRGRRDTTFTIDERLARYAVPGMSLAVIDSGRLVWSRGYGVPASASSRRVDTATLFQAGSISKAVTAAAAMRLVDQGTLRLDDDVNARLTSWKVPPSPLTGERQVTLRGLLSHGAGLNVPSFRGYAATDALPTVPQILDGVPPANTPPVRVEFAPGSGWHYSGGGYTVVQLLLADATGRDFAELLQETVIAPAGMTRSAFEQPLSPARAATAATGHSGGAPVTGGWRVYPELAAAGLWSTAPDLARFGIAILHAWQGQPNALLDQATARAMLTREIGDWGLGFALGGGAGDSTTFGHDGSTAGYTARLLVLPATGQGIAVMTNGESEALIDEVVRSVAREYRWPVRPRAEKTVATVDPAAYAPLAGRYRVQVGERAFDFVVTVDGGRLIITGPSGRPAEILPESAVRFFSRDSGNQFTFTRNGGGPVRSMTIDQQGERYTARRVP